MDWEIEAAILDAAQASMRPRRVRLGWAVSGGAAASGWKRFNEAEARAPRMDQRRRKGSAGDRASMRPRRVRLGWLASCCHGSCWFPVLQ